MFDRHGRRRYLPVILLAWLLGVPGPLSAQVPPPKPTQVPVPSDPLGRDSPFGTVTGFSAAVRRDDFAVAARFLQADRRSSREIETLARDLSGLLDRYFIRPITSLSLSREGELTDGLEPNRDRIPLTIGDSSVELFLTRVADPDAGPVWLFSSDSLARVPTLQRLDQATWVERVMPATLVARSYLGTSLAQWILWAASILAPLLLFWSLTLLVVAAARRRIADITGLAVFLSWWRGVRWLLVVGLTLAAHLWAMRHLGFGLTFRLTYARIGLFMAIVIGAMLFWRLVSVTFHQARLLAMRRGRSDTRSLILLGERVAKVLVVLIAMFGLLGLAGVDATTALAGLGIVGVAVALGAQKTVENLLGGIFLVTDRVLAIGDYCRVLDREGWVEDITLRSVRLRTAEQTLLSVPAGLLAQGSIENLTARPRLLLQSILRLRYGTTSEQLRAVLEGTERLLAKHALVDKESARVKLIAFGAQAIELELFAYVTTSEFGKFLEVRQSLLLQVAGIVESSGSAFAGPTQFIHMGGDAVSGHPRSSDRG